MFFFSFCLQQSRFLGSSANITDGVSCTVHKAVHVSFTNRLQSETLSTFAPKILKRKWASGANCDTHLDFYAPNKKKLKLKTTERNTQICKVSNIQKIFQMAVLH